MSNSNTHGDTLDSTLVDRNCVNNQQSQHSMPCHNTPQPSVHLTVSTIHDLHTHYASFITDFDLQRIVHTLRSSLRDEIPLLNEISGLKLSVKTMCNQVAVLEQDLDDANQYSRRHCVIVSNVPENEDESTDGILKQIAIDNGSNIVLSDIDSSHRNGPPKKNDGKHRDIIVNFTNYKAKTDFIKS
ncbi:hypothetical protein DPMN_052034 [Dreissena polymorpha]|uniref:Uncharacterized protein n=1 Tax=Dreissena polymorpha TaxID=45954 RepID=A0A9D4HMN8_DREPO|nr:hypothetical protein DPMN_052034 [Dreissena polymorpha]